MEKIVEGLVGKALKRMPIRPYHPVMIGHVLYNRTSRLYLRKVTPVLTVTVHHYNGFYGVPLTYLVHQAYYIIMSASVLTGNYEHG